MVSALLEHDFSIQRGNKDILIVFFKGKVFYLPFSISKARRLQQSRATRGGRQS